MNRGTAALAVALCLLGRAAVAATPCAGPELPRTPAGCDPLAFSNGDRILGADGRPIDPWSPEGRALERLLAPAGDPMAFSNGDHISRDGQEISPDSAEGRRIEAIYERQRRDREANAAQKELFWKMTNAKNAAEAQEILRRAKEKDPNAGTPNSIVRRGGSADAAPEGSGVAPSRRASTAVRPAGDPMAFSNGDHISRDGQEISPDSAEGRQIEAIYERQRRDREANAAQKELFWKMTNAKNAAEAQEILRRAKEKDPNAGTPNTINGRPVDAEDDARYRFSNGKRFSGADGKLIAVDSAKGAEIEKMLGERRASAKAEAPAPGGATAASVAAAPRGARAGAMRFSNGDRIRRKDGSTIDPASREGRQIEAILARQRRDRAANAAQKELFRKITNAKNAAEANAILKGAKAKDPNAGTPNVVKKGGKKR